MKGLDDLRRLKVQHPKTDLPFDLLPMLVRFRDVNDPGSVEQVDPNDLASAFGPGVTLRKANIAITDDPVTTGIEQKLNWLPNLETVLAGRTFRPGKSVATVLSRFHFQRGF